MTNDVPSKVYNKDIWEKVDGLEESFNAYCLASEKRLTYLETVMEIQIDDVKTLKKWDKGIGALAIIGSAVAGFLGFRN